MDETGGSTCSNRERKVARLTTAAANRGCRRLRREARELHAAEASGGGARREASPEDRL